ncbi:MAG: hypothetical protein AAFX06_07910 [Planctomycetota bacterium]
MPRRGSSYLEIQVAMVVLSVGMMGLFSLSVVHTKQSARLRAVLPPDEIASINPIVVGTPQETAWAKKLGAVAEIEMNAVATQTPIYPLNVGFQSIVDDEDGSAAFERNTGAGGFWFNYESFTDYGSRVSLLYLPDSTGAYAEYTIAVPPGEYEVLTCIPRHPLFGSAVPYQVFDGTSLIDTVNVNQQTSQNDFYHGGLWWESLGVYTFHTNTVRVRIVDAPISGTFLVADAMMVRCRRSFDLVSDVTETSSGGAQVTVELN